MSEEKQLFKITIDGKSVEVKPGTTILQAARAIGGSVVPPAMCYYSKLEGSGGKCRTCLVEVSKGSDQNPKPMPKLVPSCRTTVMDGMEVKNKTSERVLKARASIVEMLLINHPLDCPICDQAGECHLQDLSFEHGKSGSRYDFEKITFSPQDLGPYIQLHMNRCILCYRCVYTAQQVSGKRVHAVLGRGDRAEIGTYIKQHLDQPYIGNIIDVCPVGALTDRTAQFKNRVWFTHAVDAHCDCPQCSGKARLWLRGDKIIRVTARKDKWGEIEDDENGKTQWICNSCRFEKKELKDWILDNPSEMDRHSVNSINKYDQNETIPIDPLNAILKGRSPNLLMDIHTVSDVDRPDYEIEKIQGPATSLDFKD